MTTVSKKRIIKKFEQLTNELLNELKNTYPDGFEDSLITFQTPKGEIEVALPLETEEAYYLIKMPKSGYAEEDDEFGDGSGGGFSGFDNFENISIGDTEEVEETNIDDEDIDNFPDDGPDENDDGEFDDEGEEPSDDIF